MLYVQILNTSTGTSLTAEISAISDDKPIRIFYLKESGKEWKFFEDSGREVDDLSSAWRMCSAKMKDIYVTADKPAWFKKPRKQTKKRESKVKLTTLTREPKVRGPYKKRKQYIVAQSPGACAPSILEAGCVVDISGDEASLEALRKQKADIKAD